MKYCTKCGSEIMDEAVICPKCGCATGYVEPKQVNVSNEPKNTGLKTVAKVFMILGTVTLSACGFLIPLAWCLPMTLSYCKKIKNGEQVTTGFKVCSLLFVNTIAGILMLCDSD